MTIFLFPTRRCLNTQAASNVIQRFAGRIRNEQLIPTSTFDSPRDKLSGFRWGGRVQSAQRLVSENVYRAAVSKCRSDVYAVYRLRRLANLDPRPWNIFYRLHKTNVMLKDHQCATLILWTSFIVQLEKDHGRKIHALQMGHAIAYLMRKRKHQADVGVKCAHYRLCEVSGDLTTAFKLFEYEINIQSIDNSTISHDELTSSGPNGDDINITKIREYDGGNPEILFHLVWLARVAACQPSDERAEEVCQIIFDTYENQRLYRFTEEARTVEDKYRNSVKSDHISGLNPIGRAKEAADIKDYYNKVKTPNTNNKVYMGMSTRLDLQEDELFAILHQQLLPRIEVVIETDPSSNPQIIEWICAGYERYCLDRRCSLLPEGKQEKTEDIDIDELGVPSVDTLLFTRPFRGGADNIFHDLGAAPRFYAVSDYMNGLSPKSPPTMNNPYIIDSLLNPKLTKKLEKYAYYFVRDYNEGGHKRSLTEDKRRQFSLLTKLIKEMQAELSTVYTETIKKDRKQSVNGEKTGHKVFSPSDIAARKTELPMAIMDVIRGLKKFSISNVETADECHGVFPNFYNLRGFECPMFIRSILQPGALREELEHSADSVEEDVESVDNTQEDEPLKQQRAKEESGPFPLTAEIYHYLLVALAGSSSDSTAMETYRKCISRIRILDITRASMLGSIGHRLQYPKIPPAEADGEMNTGKNAKGSALKLGSVTDNINMNVSGDDHRSFLALLTRINKKDSKEGMHSYNDCFAFTSKLLQDQIAEVKFRRNHDKDNACTNAVMNYWMCNYSMFLYYRNALGYSQDYQLPYQQENDVNFSNSSSDYSTSSSGLEVFYIFVLPVLGIKKLLDIVAASEIHRKLFVSRQDVGKEDAADLQCIFSSPAEYRDFKEELLVIDDDLSNAIASYLWESCSSRKCKTSIEGQENVLPSSAEVVDQALDTITSVASKLDLSLIGQIPFLSDYSTDIPIATTLFELREKLLSYGISRENEQKKELDGSTNSKRRAIYLLDPSFFESGQHVSTFTKLVKQTPSTHHPPLILIPYPTLRQLADTAQMRGTASYLHNYLDTEVLYTGDGSNGEEAPQLNKDMSHNERLDVQTSLKSLRSISQLLKRVQNNIAIFHFSECLMGYYYTPSGLETSSRKRCINHVTNNEKYDQWLLQIASMIRHIGVDSDSGNEHFDVHICSDDPSLLYRIGSSQTRTDITPMGDNERNIYDSRGGIIDETQLSILCEGIKFVSTNSVLPVLCNGRKRPEVPLSGELRQEKSAVDTNMKFMKKTGADIVTTALVDGHYINPMMQCLHGAPHERNSDVIDAVGHHGQSVLSPESLETVPSGTDFLASDMLAFEPVLIDRPVVPLSEEDKGILGRNPNVRGDILNTSSSDLTPDLRVGDQGDPSDALDIIDNSTMEAKSSWMDLLDSDDSDEGYAGETEIGEDSESHIPGEMLDASPVVLGDSVMDTSPLHPSISNKGPIVLGEEIDVVDLLMSPIKAANRYAERQIYSESSDGIMSEGSMYGEFLSTKAVPLGELNTLEEQQKALVQRLGSFRKGTKREKAPADPRSSVYDKAPKYIDRRNTDTTKGGIEPSGNEHEDPQDSGDPRKKENSDANDKSSMLYDYKGRRNWSLDPLEQDHLANIPLSKADLRLEQLGVSKALKNSVSKSLQYHVYEVNVNDPRNKEIVGAFRQKVQESEQRSIRDRKVLADGLKRES